MVFFYVKTDGSCSYFLFQEKSFVRNCSLPFYFINPYRHTYVTDNDGGWRNGVFLIGADSKTDSFSLVNSVLKYKLNPCFAHAIDPRFAKEGKLLPGAILPVLQYHANCNTRLYPGRVLTIEQDFVGDVVCHDDRNEVVLVIGTTAAGGSQI